MAGLGSLIGTIAGALVGYTVTKGEGIGWEAVGIGIGIIGGAAVGNAVDTATGV